MADTARQVGFSEALPALNSVMEAVVGDDETDVRLTLAEQIGELAHIFFDTGGEEGYQQVVEMLLTQVGTLLVDDQATVRAAAGASSCRSAPPSKHSLTHSLTHSHSSGTLSGRKSGGAL
eukprot:SAG31_NODE_1920_length_6919_cov_7.423754_2_plen_120_part_00